MLVLVSLAQAAGGATLVKDMNTQPASPSPDPTLFSQFVTIGAVTYFVAQDATNGTELWRTDGTPTGTFLVKDIWPGSGSGLSSSNAVLTRVDERLFFLANDGAVGEELWVSDGTAAGTWLVRDLTPEQETSSLSNFMGVQTTLFFIKSNTDGRYELWRSDGTAAETRRTIVFPLSLVPYPIAGNGEIFFITSDDDARQAQVWRSDGTDAGTEVVASYTHTNEYGSVNLLAVIGDTLFFQVVAELQPGEKTFQLWTLAPDAAAPTLVLDGQPGKIGDAAVAAEKLFFKRAQDGDDSPTLWVSDGTPGGSSLLAQGVGDGALFGGSERFFFVRSNGQQDELWTSDGTVAHTVRLHTLSAQSEIRRMQSFQGQHFFIESTATTGQLWRTDGTAAGTRLVRAFDQPLRDMTSTGQALIFVDIYQRVWSSDGTASGTRLVKDFGAPASANPDMLVNATTRLFFTADDGRTGREVWVSDGTAGQTQLTEDLTPGASSSELHLLTTLGNDLIFTTGETTTLSLWRSTGSTSRPRLIMRAARLNPLSSSPWDPFAEVITINNRLFFSASTPDGTVALWGSDGSAAGTTMLRDAAPAALDVAASSDVPARGFYATELTNLNGSLFFYGYAMDGTSPDRAQAGLWRSDGTPGGTVLVRPLAVRVADMIATDTTLFFHDVISKTLWRSDGTATGTVEIKQFQGFLSNLTRVGSRLFFVEEEIVYSPDGGDIALGQDIVIRVWTSDGTDAGTQLLVESPVLYNRRDAYFPELAAVEQMLFFTWKDADHGRELWSSDGTLAGTRLVKDMRPGPGDSHLSSLRAIGTRLVFGANDGQNGHEVWRSDGTTAGTVLMADVAPGWANANPQFFTRMGRQIFFAADDGSTGRELWSLPLTALTGTPPPAVTLSIPPSVTVGQATPFEAVVQGEVASITWEFGDGTPGKQGANLRTVTHTYAHIGAYPVTVRLLGADGAVLTSATHVVQVTWPELQVTSNLLTPLGDMTVLTAHILPGPPPSMAYTLTWDFGDGSPHIIHTNQLTASHLYLRPGIYTITTSLLLAGNILVGTMQTTVLIGEPTVTASSSATWLGETTTLTVTVSPPPPPALAYRVVWAFGDGTPESASATLTTTHPYTRTGDVLATATLLLADGTPLVSDTTRVRVRAPTLTLPPPSPTLLGTPTVFTAMVTGPTPQLSWDFGDGTPLLTGSALVVSHSYTQTGTYLVRVTLHGAYGFTQPQTMAVPVVPLLLTSDEPSLLDVPTSFTLTVSRVYTDPVVTWDFGDGALLTNTTALTPSHTYREPGSYTATAQLAVNTEEGVVAATTPVAVRPLVVTSSSPTALGNTTTVTAQVSPRYAPAALVWTLGDGTVLTTTGSSTVRQRYLYPGDYRARVVAQDAAGLRLATGETTVQVVAARVDTLITPEDGGMLVSPAGLVRVEVPAGATAAVLTLTYSALLTPTVAFTDGAVPLVSFVLTATTEDGRAAPPFALPATLAVRYAGLPTAGPTARPGQDARLRLAAYAPTLAGWGYLPEHREQVQAEMVASFWEGTEMALVRVQGGELFLPLVRR